MSVFIALVLLTLLSLYLRIDNNRRAEMFDYPEHAKPSPFSNALQQLVGHAGGIYLSLILLVSFLQIDITHKWQIMGVKLEPLAFIALMVAIIQPFIIKTFRTMKG